MEVCGREHPRKGNEEALGRGMRGLPVSRGDFGQLEEHWDGEELLRGVMEL